MTLTIFIIFVSSCAENALCGMGGRGARHNKRRLLRFGFDVLKLRNFQIVCQKQSNVDVPWVCYIHASLAVQPLVYHLASVHSVVL